MSEPTVSKVHTACLGCVHAIYDGTTQTGCKFGRLDKFREHGAEIVDVYDLEENEFFVINNRVCMWKRSPEWNAKYGFPSKEKSSKIIREESRLAIHLVVDNANTIEDIRTTVKQINAMTDQPSEVTFVRKANSTLRPPTIIAELKNLTCRWHLSNYTDDEMDIDDTLHSIKYPYFFYVQAGRAIPENYLTMVNDMVHYDLFRFAYILPDVDDQHLTVAQTQIYKTLNIKLKYLPLLEKEESCKNMIVRQHSLYQISQ